MMCFHHSVKESNSMSVVRHLRESKYIKHGFGEATICGHHRLADLDDDQHGLNHPAPSADGDPCGCWNLQQLLLLNRHRRGCTTTSVAICNLQKEAVIVARHRPQQQQHSVAWLWIQGDSFVMEYHQVVLLFPTALNEGMTWAWRCSTSSTASAARQFFGKRQTFCIMPPLATVCSFDISNKNEIYIFVFNTSNTHQHFGHLSQIKP